MIGLFVRLKLRLLRNVLRGSSGLGLVIFTMAALGAAVVVGLLLARSTPSQRADASPILAAVFTVGWMVGPLLFGASDETIDTTRLAMFPLDPRRLAIGMAASGIIGPGPIAAAIPFLVIVAQATTPLGVVLGLLATIMTLLVATTTSRWILTALGARLRQRRSRDLATLLTGVAVAGVGVAAQALTRFGPGVDAAALHQWAEFARLTPMGWAGDAVGRSSQGEILRPVAELIGSGLLVGTLLERWTHTLERALTDVDEGGPTSSLDGHLLGTRPFLLPPLLAAVTAKERRYLSRHPRYRVQVVSQGTVLLLGGAPFLSAVVSKNPDATLLGCIPGLTAGVTGSNLLGSDGRALWAEYVAVDSLRPILRGRSLAFIGLGIGASFVLTLAVAAWTGGWTRVPVALSAAVGMALTGAGIGTVTSTLAPVPFPDDNNPNPFATTTPGRGCLNGTLTFTGVMVGLLLAVPILFGLGAASSSTNNAIAVVFGAPAYGMAVWLVTTRFAGHRASKSGPLLMERMSQS